MITKEAIIKLLQERSHQALMEAALKETKRTLRFLVSLAYDKESIICWRAIESIGIISGEITKTNPEISRNFAQRILWMMRDESGNNPWSAPEILGEIVRNSPDQFQDIAPVIASFHDEEILRPGVLRAMVRIGEIRPDLVRSASSLAGAYLSHKDDIVRAYAIMLAGILQLTELADSISALRNDNTIVKLYNNGEFQNLVIGEIAGKI